MFRLELTLSDNAWCVKFTQTFHLTILFIQNLFAVTERKRDRFEVDPRSGRVNQVIGQVYKLFIQCCAAPAGRPAGAVPNVSMFSLHISL